MTYINCSPHFETIVHEIDQIVSSFPHEKKDTGYGYRWTFTNSKHRFDCIDYANNTCHGVTIMRFGRGALLVKKYPVLAGLFDEILEVIAKFEVPTVQTLYDKNLPGLCEMMNNLKPWKYNEIVE